MYQGQLLIQVAVVVIITQVLQLRNVKVSIHQWQLGQNGELALLQYGLSGGTYGVLHGMEQVFSEKRNNLCKYCDGIAAASETGWRVIARVNEHLVKVVFR